MASGLARTTSRRAVPVSPLRAPFSCHHCTRRAKSPRSAFAASTSQHFARVFKAPVEQRCPPPNRIGDTRQDGVNGVADGDCDFLFSMEPAPPSALRRSLRRRAAVP
jgi:hypothetical protein